MESVAFTADLQGWMFDRISACHGNSQSFEVIVTYLFNFAAKVAICKVESNSNIISQSDVLVLNSSISAKSYFRAGSRLYASPKIPLATVLTMAMICLVAMLSLAALWSLLLFHPVFFVFLEFIFERSFLIKPRRWPLRYHVRLDGHRIHRQDHQ